MSFDKRELEHFRERAEYLLESLAEEMELDIKVGKITYDTNSFEARLIVNKTEVDGKSFEQSEFEKLSVLYGLKPSDYGKKFISYNTVYIVKNINTNAKKFPINATEEKTGDSYKFTASEVRESLERGL